MPPPEAPANEFPDPLARGGAVAIGVARIGLGAAICASTHRALAGLGFEHPGTATLALARLAGSRDIALGLHALANANERPRLREAVAICALVDAGDALAFSLASRGKGGLGAAGVLNASLGAGAALAGAWVLSRL